MLVVSGIILTCLSGLLLTGIIGTRFSWTERIGLSFPLGMTLQTVVMALLDLMHIPDQFFGFIGGSRNIRPIDVYRSPLPRIRKFPYHLGYAR